MKNLYYRCYVIHEDILSICYTIIGPRPDRSELNQRSSLMEAMHWVDRQAEKQTTAKWAERDSTRQQNSGHSRPSQPALL